MCLMLRSNFTKKRTGAKGGLPKGGLPIFFFTNHEISNLYGEGGSIPMTPTSQYFLLFKVNFGTIIFAARKSGGNEPCLMLRSNFAKRGVGAKGATKRGG